jgi:hypothetical protein
MKPEKNNFLRNELYEKLLSFLASRKLLNAIICLIAQSKKSPEVNVSETQKNVQECIAEFLESEKFYLLKVLSCDADFNVKYLQELKNEIAQRGFKYNRILNEFAHRLEEYDIYLVDCDPIFMNQLVEKYFGLIDSLIAEQKS